MSSHCSKVELVTQVLLVSLVIKRNSIFLCGIFFLKNTKIIKTPLVIRLENSTIITKNSKHVMFVKCFVYYLYTTTLGVDK